MGKYTSHHLFQYSGLVLHEFNDWFRIAQYKTWTADYRLWTGGKTRTEV